GAEKRLCRIGWRRERNWDPTFSEQDRAIARTETNHVLFTRRREALAVRLGPIVRGQGFPGPLAPAGVADTRRPAAQSTPRGARGCPKQADVQDHRPKITLPSCGVF